MLHGRAGSVEDERCGSLKPLRTISLQRERKGIDSAPGAVYVLNDGVIVRFFTMEPVVWNTRAVEPGFVIICICDNRYDKKAR